MRRHPGILWGLGAGILLLLTAGLVQGVAPALAAEVILFGPAQYTRTSGPPNQFAATIAVPPTVAAPFRLHIQNGNSDGTHRVSSATLFVNGTLVASPSDFSQQ